MSDGLYLCQKEIQRLRSVVRTYEAQMRELENYLGRMAEDPVLGEEARKTAREIYRTWRWILED